MPDLLSKQEPVYLLLGMNSHVMHALMFSNGQVNLGRPAILNRIVFCKGQVSQSMHRLLTHSL